MARILNHVCGNYPTVSNKICFFFQYAGHYERPPYNESTIRSVYHVREYDVQKLMQVEEPVDIFLSHDWPLGITDYGKWEELVRRKPYFKKEVIIIILKSYPCGMCYGFHKIGLNNLQLKDKHGKYF